MKPVSEIVKSRSADDCIISDKAREVQEADRPPTVYEMVVERIASIIREHYIRLRCRAQGIASFSPSEKRNKYFAAAAASCIEHRMSPKEFVETQFAALKPYPEISALGTQAAIGRYDRVRNNLAVEVAKSVALQTSAYESLLRAGHDPKETIVDKYQAFDPLFVYITATAHGFSDIADAYYEAAAAQYFTSSHYDEIYKEAIPAALKELSR